VTPGPVSNTPSNTVSEPTAAEAEGIAAPSTAAPAATASAGAAAPATAETAAAAAAAVQPAASSAPVLVAANTPAPEAVTNTLDASTAAPAVATVAVNAPPGTAATSVAPDIEPETNAGGIPAQVALQESEQDARAVAKSKPLAADQPVDAKQAEAITPSLGPASVVAADNADATDYSVATDDTIVVAATESLGLYAGWLNVSPARLRAVNHLHGKGGVQIGRKLKLDFAHTSHAQFESQRRDYHRVLQASYFATHRISGTQVHVVRAGDSLWNLTHRFGVVPTWLRQQYNPDVDFDNLRAGTQLVLPRVADLGDPDQSDSSKADDSGGNK
jgi:nucleoid-associated protein YgaU